MANSLWKATAHIQGFHAKVLGTKFRSRDKAKKALEKYVARELEWYDYPALSRAVLSGGSRLYEAKEVPNQE